MPNRWSKLQSRLYNIIDPEINFQLHCSLYEMNSKDGWHGSKLPRYFITIDKDIVFDYPKDFDTKDEYGFTSYPWGPDISDISCMIEEYIQTPTGGLLNKFENDKWGITDILRVCDRRIGKRRLEKLQSTVENEILLGVVERRLNKK